MLYLSFEGNTLRLLEAHGKKVVRWHSALFNTALVRRGAVTDPAGLSQVVTKALETGGFRGRDVFAALDGVGSLSRTVSVPRATPVKLSDFIPREARRLWSLTPEDAFLYWHPISGSKTQFFVLSVPREPLLAFTETLRLAGLRLARVDIRPLCLARATNQAQAVLLCAEGNSIVIVILVDHVPALMQTHWLGETPLLPEAIAPQASTLLGQAVAFYNDSHASAPLPADTPLFVCGAVADQALRERLQAETGYSARDITPPFPVPAEFTVPHFAVNLGLLLKAL